MVERRGVVLCPQDLAGLDWIDRCRAMGLNTLGVHGGGGLGTDVRGKLGDTVGQVFRRRASQAGLDVEYELHAASDLVPREAFGEHPDWFVYDPREQARTAEHNFCTSSEKACQLAGKRAAALAKDLCPDTGRFFFWSDDGRGWCHCDRCAHLSSADQELRLANLVARSLAPVTANPEVAFLAYHKTLEVPRQVTPAAGVFLEFAPIERCYRHAIDDPSCAINGRHWRALKALLEVFPAETAHVLEYWLDSSMASRWRQPVQPCLFRESVCRADIAAYRRLGIGSFTTFACWIDATYVAQYGDAVLDGYARCLAQ